MSSLSYFAQNGSVYFVDGPWEVRLTEAQCDQLLDIFEQANALASFNALYSACQAAGHIERCISRPHLRVVSSHEPSPLRQQLEASIAAIRSEPPGAA